MERNVQRNGLVNLFALLLAGAAGFAVARFANSAAGQISSVFAGLGLLVSFVSWFQMRLEDNERAEKLELDELARTRGSATLFEGREAELFPAQRARRQFEKFFVPGFTILLFVLQALAALFIWRALDKISAGVAAERWTIAAALFGVLFIVLFILGRFSATIARLENHRLLRPSASYTLLGAYLSAVTALGIAGVQAEVPKADLFVARGFCVLLGLAALETLITLVLEIYRPRVKGKVIRPIYDSRLVGLISQPEGLVTTAAHALDYQFGFKVSETWFYRFFEDKWLLLVLGQFAVLLVSTSFVFVESGEQALLERFGRPVVGHEVLGAGPHLKLPWPIDKVYRYRTEQIQTLSVGFSPEEEEHEQTIQWTLAHGKEDNFLVAKREQPGVESGAPGDTRKAPPVSLLTVNIPVQFQVTNLTAWVYHHTDSSNLLQQISTREIVRYLVSADLGDIMSHGRQAAADALRERIQAAASANQLGANILFVGLQGIHPPVKVASDYEKVVAEIHKKEAKILDAKADAIRTNTLAGAQAFSLTNTAEANRLRLEVSAVARAAAFTNRIPAFNAAPSVYLQRAYFQTFAKAVADAPKYLVLTTNTHDVYQFDLQEKVGEKLLKATAEELSKPKP